MNVARSAGIARAEVAESEVVIVRADDDGFLAWRRIAAREHGHDVFRALAYLFQGNLKRRAQAGERDGCGFFGTVDFFLERAERNAKDRKPAFHEVAFHLYRNQAP